MSQLEEAGQSMCWELPELGIYSSVCYSSQIFSTSQTAGVFSSWEGLTLPFMKIPRLLVPCPLGNTSLCHSISA